MPDVLSITPKTSQTERNSNGVFFKQQYSSDEYVSFKSAEQDEAETSKKIFSRLQVCAYTSVIGNVIQNLRILGTLGSSSIIPVDIEYKTLEQKYGLTEYHPNHFDAPLMEPSGPKFQKDRGYVAQILTEINLEMESTGEITHFMDRLDEYRRSESEREELLEEAKTNQEKLKELQHLQDTSRSRLKEKLHSKSQQLQKIAAIYEDMLYENRIKKNYHNSWENSRTYLNNFLVGWQEGNLRDAINFTLKDNWNEMRVHSEIEYYEKELQKEYTELIETWMGNYEKDLENNEMALQVLKEKRTNQLEELKDLENEYKKREKEMSDYIIARDIRVELEEKLRKTTEAAVKIQAWWRGLMYRLRLGPYRKKNKNKKKKDKKRK